MLIAGNINVLYKDGALRYFKVNELEVLRMIYFTVRDANWGTFQPKIYDEKVIENEHSFQINYRADFEENNETFISWNVEIQGVSSNKITFEINGEAKKDFKTNRAGFCVLHPIEGLAGENLKITHSNFSEEEATFPKYIAPFQPFFDIKSMKWVLGKNDFILDFEGDIFETEDQRNWGDASYKTYCTPLEIPFPRLIKNGDKIHQKITFQAEINTDKNFKIDLKKSNKNTFDLGICVSENDYTSKIIDQLKPLNLSHFRIEIYFEADWENRFLHKINQLSVLEIPLEIILILSNYFENELKQFIALNQNNNLNIKYLALFSKDEMVTNQAIIDFIPNLKKVINTKIGVGTNYNFTEINRYIFDAKHADFISFAFDPQEHATDNLTILENAETVKYQVESAIKIYNKPIHISPILLKGRFNPYATDENARIISIEDQKDFRQKTDFLAKWAEKLFENSGNSCVESVSFLETHGELGIMDLESNQYPVYEKIKDFLINQSLSKTYVTSLCISE
jgi:D-apionolactonase